MRDRRRIRARLARAEQRRGRREEEVGVSAEAAAALNEYAAAKATGRPCPAWVEDYIETLRQGE